MSNRRTDEFEGFLRNSIVGEEGGPPRDKQISTYISDDMFEEIRVLAFRRHASISGIIRLALESYLEAAKENAA